MTEPFQYIEKNKNKNKNNFIYSLHYEDIAVRYNYSFYSKTKYLKIIMYLLFQLLIEFFFFSLSDKPFVHLVALLYLRENFP